MDSETSYFFGALAAQLRAPSRRRSRAVIERWAGRAPDLGHPAVTAPADVPRWLARQPRHVTDAVLAALVGLAQEGDPLAFTCVLVCLRPGACRLIASLPVTEGEVVSELALRLSDYPVARRPRAVAGGILLDVRNRLCRAARRAGREMPSGAGLPPVLADAVHAPRPRVASPTGTGPVDTVERSAGDTLVDVVAAAHRAGALSAGDASLILRWRLLDEPPHVTARRHGTSPSAAKKRRQRAEARLLAAA